MLEQFSAPDLPPKQIKLSPYMVRASGKHYTMPVAIVNEVIWMSFMEGIEAMRQGQTSRHRWRRRSHCHFHRFRDVGCQFIKAIKPLLTEIIVERGRKFEMNGNGLEWSTEWAEKTEGDRNKWYYFTIPICWESQTRRISNINFAIPFQIEWEKICLICIFFFSWHE